MARATAPSNPTSPLARLLELQSVDAHADQLRYQMEHHPARVALDELVARHRAGGERSAPVAQRVAELATRQSDLEGEIEQTTRRIAAIEGRLRSGATGSYRDEEAMSEEIASLVRRRTHLEDEELEVMEEREPFDAELAALVGAEAEREEEARARRVELATAQKDLARELEEVEVSREAIASEIDPALREEYERLRKRLGGVGVAQVEHGMCSGCNLALSAGEIDHIRHGTPGALFHCEQCGRILVA